MVIEDRWLRSGWPLVASALPAPPARVVEIGCGSLGGFVPELVDRGYDAVGVDPHAPDGPAYRRIRFEEAGLEPADAVIASASLHHVQDPPGIIDRIASLLVPGGKVIVIECDWARFDQPTAEWCFQRLGHGGSWLHRHRDRWQASTDPWETYFSGWVADEHLNRTDELLALLDARFDRVHLARGAYFFADLADTSEEEERAAIDAGAIQPGRLEFVGAVPGTASIRSHLRS
jgi:SAM-dependent methyltransferase